MTPPAGPGALVRWCEDPPKWDVVNVKDIVKYKGLGAASDVKYKGQLFPAIILELGKLKPGRMLGAGGGVTWGMAVFPVFMSDVPSLEKNPLES